LIQGTEKNNILLIFIVDKKIL
jgi:hypothetical protein